eukprot:7391795-Prymnesium_polylepis.2
MPARKLKVAPPARSSNSVSTEKISDLRNILRMTVVHEAPRQRETSVTALERRRSKFDSVMGCATIGGSCVSVTAFPHARTSIFRGLSSLREGATMATCKPSANPFLGSHFDVSGSKGQATPTQR